MIGSFQNSFQTSVHRTLPWGLNLCLGCVYVEELRCTEKLQRPALLLSVGVAGGIVQLCLPVEVKGQHPVPLQWGLTRSS